MYNIKSQIAEEFISDEEIRDTMEYAKNNSTNKELIKSILQKARECKGITHREAALLLECDDQEIINEIYEIAREIKHRFYGNRIVMFAPLYLSNYCVNGCVYCPYHLKNKTIRRKKLSQEEIRQEVIALQDMGHKRLALEAGEHPVENPIEYILESIKTIYSIKHKNGAIRRVNVNIAATTVENYQKLRDAGIGTYILFQETYNKKNYEALHPTGPKSNYAYHTEAMDRAMQGGIDDVGIGVLFGLETYRYDFVGLLMHAEHLEAVHGVGPHTISLPRLKRADDIDPDEFDNGIRGLLNFGHTFGHAIEKLSNFSVSHGEAVAKGMVIASRIAPLCGLCDVADELAALLVKYKFDISCSYTAMEVYDALLTDKKRRGGNISVALPRSIGDCELYTMPVEELKVLLSKVLA
mgnify:CR=1 FL=1